MTSIQTSFEILRVGIAEGKVARYPDRLKTTGLGSCVGVVLYDRAAEIAGLVHIMLPATHKEQDALNSPQKYANTGIPWLVEAMKDLGARQSRMTAKIAGGAQMFATTGSNDILRVGPRNVAAVHECLQDLSIQVAASDVGGKVGRTIEFDGLTERLSIRTAMTGTYVI